MKNPTRWFFLVLVILSCSSNTFEFVEESYSDGTPKLVRFYKNDSKEVLLKETQFYHGGAKYLEGHYKNGERNGTWTAWYQNGNVWSTGKYKKGIENGKKTVYHENGQQYYEGEVKDEKRVGVWTFWDKEGSFIKEIDYNKQ